MASKYWIKLYHEILEDHKMGKLPDNLWRRVVELFLLAGEVDQDGLLPSTDDIAWKLRLDVVTIRDELQQLCVTGILEERENDTWFVRNFAKRQGPVSDKERKQRQREREKRPNFQINKETKPIQPALVTKEPVTNCDTDTDTDTDTDIKTKAAQPPLKPHSIPAVQIFVEVTGKYCLSKPQMKEVEEVVGNSPINLEKWRDVVKEWGMRGFKPTNAAGMLDWFRNGIPERHKGQSTNGHQRTNKTGANGNTLKPRAMGEATARAIDDEIARLEHELGLSNPLNAPT